MDDAEAPAGALPRRLHRRRRRLRETKDGAFINDALHTFHRSGLPWWAELIISTAQPPSPFSLSLSLSLSASPLIIFSTWFGFTIGNRKTVNGVPWIGLFDSLLPQRRKTKKNSVKKKQIKKKPGKWYALSVVPAWWGAFIIPVSPHHPLFFSDRCTRFLPIFESNRRDVMFR